MQDYNNFCEIKASYTDNETDRQKDDIKLYDIHQNTNNETNVIKELFIDQTNHGLNEYNIKKQNNDDADRKDDRDKQHHIVLDGVPKGIGIQLSGVTEGYVLRIVAAHYVHTAVEKL